MFLTFLNAQENVFVDIIITIIATAVAAVLLKKAKNLAKMELHGWQRKTKPNDGFHHLVYFWFTGGFKKLLKKAMVEDVANESLLISSSQLASFHG